jgi:hypothetical protein
MNASAAAPAAPAVPGSREPAPPPAAQPGPPPGRGGAPGQAPGLPPERALVQMLMATRVQQAISVAAALGVADLLADGPLTIDELGRAAGAHPAALARLLRALAAHGVFTEAAPGRFALTPLAALLRGGVPGSLRPVALWCGSVAYTVFGGLEHSVRTGEPAFDHLFGMEFFEYLERNPETGALFDAFMARQTAAVAATLPSGYDFSGIGTLVDVGGGRGELLAAILRAHPEMRGILFDRPQVVERARDALREAGLAGRCIAVAGDLAEAVPPGGDAYLMKSIVHAAPDAEAARWLEACGRAMDGRGRLLLVEFVLPEGNEPHPGKLMDVLMLVGTHGGRERTAAEFGALLARAGFRMTRIVPTESFYAVVEAVPA